MSRGRRPMPSGMIDAVEVVLATVLGLAVGLVSALIGVSKGSEWGWSDGRTIGAGDLPDELHLGAVSATASTPDSKECADDEAAQLAKIAYSFSGSRKMLAEQLGISERTLYRRLASLGLSRRKAAKK